MAASSLHVSLPSSTAAAGAPELIAPVGLHLSGFDAPEGRVLVLSYPLPRPAFLQRLSESEAGVVLLAMCGQSNAEIAHIRSASPRTVANQLASAYRKLGGVSRSRLSVPASVIPPAPTPTTALFSVIEAVYRPELSEQTWLRGLAEAMRPLLDQGLGVAAWTTRDTRAGRVIQRTAGEQLPRGLLQGLLQAADDAPLFVRAFHGRELSLLRAQLCARDSAAVVALRILRAHGARDLLAITASDGDLTLSVGAPLHYSRLPSSSEHARYLRVAEHLKAGLRLRAAHQTSNAPDTLPSHEEMRSDPRASGDPARRERLRDAAISTHAVPSSDAEAACSSADAWTALMQGRLRPVDHFDTAGRHFLLARDASAQEVRYLISARQRQVLALRASGNSLKEIAHDLRLSTSTVAVDLSKTLRVLGLRSACELAF